MGDPLERDMIFRAPKPLELPDDEDLSSQIDPGSAPLSLDPLEVLEQYSIKQYGWDTA
jgi:hypothetical protein